MFQYKWIAVLVACLACAAASARAGDIPEAKQTRLGLYVTAEEAFAKWQADPQHIKILDVRTVEEYVFVGHATMACNIPFRNQTHEWASDGKRLAMEPNPDFISLVQEWAKPSATILVMCRSGGRSAMAVNALAEAGYTNVYSIVDGMEGDVVKEPDSLFQGKHMKNGWKNAGLPWTYDLDPEQMRIGR